MAIVRRSWKFATQNDDMYSDWGVLVVADASDMISLSEHVLSKNKSEGWENRLRVTFQMKTVFQKRNGSTCQRRERAWRRVCEI